MSIQSVGCKNCGNDLWDLSIEPNTVECTNCLRTRPFYRRRTNQFEDPSPTQLERVQTIREYFAEFLNDGNDPMVETDLSPTGQLWIKVSTNKNFYLDDGGTFLIGRRGRVSILTVYGYQSEARTRATLYQSMLKSRKNLKVHISEHV